MPPAAAHAGAQHAQADDDALPGIQGRLRHLHKRVHLAAHDQLAEEALVGALRWRMGGRGQGGRYGAEGVVGKGTAWQQMIVVRERQQKAGAPAGQLQRQPRTQRTPDWRGVRRFWTTRSSRPHSAVLVS